MLHYYIRLFCREHGKTVQGTYPLQLFTLLAPEVKWAYV